MGSSYANVHVKMNDVNVVRAALRKCDVIPAYLSKSGGGWISIFPEDSEKEICQSLSAELKCPVFAFQVYDSDVFYYWLYVNGEMIDEYDSWPGYFDGNGDKPVGGKVQEVLSLCLPGTTFEQLDELLHGKEEKAETHEAPSGMIGELMKSLTPKWLAAMTSPRNFMPWQGDSLAIEFAEKLGIGDEQATESWDDIDSESTELELVS